MAGLVPAISLREPLCPPKRGRRDKPGDDNLLGAAQLHLSATDNAGDEIRDRLESCFRRFPLRRVPRARHQCDLDRGITFLLRDLDLLDRAVLITLALHDENGTRI